ncbi:hypothetical protein Tco_1014446 [Tanacetum coccineum]
MRGKQSNEFTSSGYNQAEKQTPNILTHIQNPATLEALDNVPIGYGSGCDVPSIGALMGVSVIPFGGTSATEGMFHFLGTPSASCRIEHSIIFGCFLEKYSRSCREISRGQPNMAFRGSPSSADVVGVNSEKRKLKANDDADDFQA